MEEDAMSLLRSKVKTEILQVLQKESMTPLMLSKVLKRPRASISRAVVQLSQLKLVKCLNPKADRWREYTITAKGKGLLKKIKRFK